MAWNERGMTREKERQRKAFFLPRTLSVAGSEEEEERKKREERRTRPALLRHGGPPKSVTLWFGSTCPLVYATNEKPF
jgi:hypothetical protein